MSIPNYTEGVRAKMRYTTCIRAAYLRVRMLTMHTIDTNLMRRTGSTMQSGQSVEERFRTSFFALVPEMRRLGIHLPLLVAGCLSGHSSFFLQ